MNRPLTRDDASLVRLHDINADGILDAVVLFDSSPSAFLGALLGERRARRAGDLHEALHGSIYIHAVTQLEIASTEIRRLVAEGYDPRYLMPDSVRAVIMESSCYRKCQPITEEADNA